MCNSRNVLNKFGDKLNKVGMEYNKTPPNPQYYAT